MGFCYCNVYSRCVVIADGVGGQTLQLMHGYCLTVFERRVAKFLFRSWKGNSRFCGM